MRVIENMGKIIRESGVNGWVSEFKDAVDKVKKALLAGPNRMQTRHCLK